jgi:hypothetical protein
MTLTVQLQSKPDQTPVTDPIVKPLEIHELTDDERQQITEMGTTVSRLILDLLDDDTKKTRRWPFHPVK